MRFMVIVSLIISVVIPLSPVLSTAESQNNPPVSVPGIVTITASVTDTPPQWAVMERYLITFMEEEAAPFYLDTFTRRGGTPYGGGPYDDVYEMFYNWPLLYAIGGDEKLFDWGLQEYNAITRHCTVYDPEKFDYFHQLYQEFPEHDDWFHISEGITAFYNLALGDPTIPENIDRARRFAGLFLNENPEALNYDFQYKIIPSIATGSRGAMDSRGSGYDLTYGHASLYPLVKELEPGWNKDQKRREELQILFDEVVTRCDVPVNLGATALVTNAYLYTGEEKYKQWVLDYVDAWMKRIEENNGILPDNIGRTGKIGEYRKGQWWGGLYGWTGRYSIHMIFGALTVASECAYLLSGDPRYLDLLRSQIDVLLGQEKLSSEGELQVPYKYGPDGWTDYRPMMVRDLSHLWHASMSREDWERIERVKNGSTYNWSITPSEGNRTAGGTEAARLMYYAGENPDWPVDILMAEYREVKRRIEFIRSDPRDIASITADELYYHQPVLTKGLQQVTMGAPQTLYNGGLLPARVRYFDTDMARPGLPDDVAALVEVLEADRTVVTLVNLSSLTARRLIVQAGAFAQHEFTEVTYREQVKDDSGKVTFHEKSIPVNNRYLALELPPARSIKLDMGTARFVHDPTYAFPWHNGKVPVK